MEWSDVRPIRRLLMQVCTTLSKIFYFNIFALINSWRPWLTFFVSWNGSNSAYGRAVFDERDSSNLFWPVPRRHTKCVDKHNKSGTNDGVLDSKQENTPKVLIDFEWLPTAGFGCCGKWQWGFVVVVHSDESTVRGVGKRSKF